MTDQDLTRQILEEYRRKLTVLLDDDLDSVVLYGSRARGDAVKGSDIDLLCIMKRPFDYGELITKSSEITAEVSLKHDVVISRVFVTRGDLQARRTPFLMNIHKEQIPL